VTEPSSPLTAWRERQRVAESPPAPAGPVEGRAAYGQAALEGELERVRGAVQGERNGTLYLAALKVGSLIAGGHVDEDQGRTALIVAGTSTGLTRAETVATVRSGLRNGMGTPRVPLERPDAPAEHAATEVTELPPVDDTPHGSVTVTEPPPERSIGEGYLRPGTWLLNLPPNPPAVWGEGETVLWAQGEACMIAALPGLGKTTVAGQLVRARLGLDDAVLELPVLEGKRVLYLCMDRPQQIARSLLRAFDRDEIADLGDRLVLGWGPPPADVARSPEILVELAASAQADTLVVDSLKDAALKLTDDEVGASYNRARQLAITAGVEVLELHHLVKRNAEGKPPSSLADVYGSAWLTAGAGSVIVLTGEPGDPIVRAMHLKQPREPWGPVWISHDHAVGRSSVHNRVDLLELLAITTVQTATTAAVALYETERPSRAQTEKARRALERLVRAGLAVTEPGRPGAEGGSGATRYRPASRPPFTETEGDRE
jgi:replicative DNA helicase